MASNALDSFISSLEKTSGANSSDRANPKQEKGQYFVDQNTSQYYFQSGLACVLNHEILTFSLFGIGPTDGICTGSISQPGYERIQYI